MNAITLKNIHKSYGAHKAVDNLSLDIPKGSVYALLGPNGAGKSTTLGILGGWIADFEGQGQILNQNLRSLHLLSAQVGVLPQDATLPENRNVIDNLSHLARLQGMASPKARDDARRVLAMVGLEASAQQKPGELSFGMRKRLGLAQAWLGEPKLLILDEPTAGLDPKQAFSIREWINEHRGNATVLISSHRLSELEDLCSHGAILDQGALIGAGTLDSLRQGGTDIFIDVEPEATQAFGELSVRGVAPKIDGKTLHYCCPEHVESTVFVTDALKVLIEKNLLISSVKRGRSLEAAFLAATNTIKE